MFFDDRGQPAQRRRLPARLVQTRQRCAVRGISSDVNCAITFCVESRRWREQIAVHGDIVLVGDRNNRDAEVKTRSYVGD